MFNRPRSYVNLSSFLLWGLGVATVVWASMRSADDLRRRSKPGLDGDGSYNDSHGIQSHEESPVSYFRSCEFRTLIEDTERHEYVAIKGDGWVDIRRAVGLFLR